MSEAAATALYQLIIDSFLACNYSWVAARCSLWACTDSLFVPFQPLKNRTVIRVSKAAPKLVFNPRSALWTQHAVFIMEVLLDLSWRPLSTLVAPWIEFLKSLLSHKTDFPLSFARVESQHLKVLHWADACNLHQFISQVIISSQ